ncbi:TPA: DEAD/DEAH box helicase [Klebsiella pneumoniae]|nr:DEAD/DEAH box helicase [Klebsiella pneumoniae]HDQ3421582.1 DEAD/DEAH box helicase [Klebsiella pneumoniae]
MNTSAVFESAGLSLRKVQQDYIEAAAGALTQDHKVALISAETGVGKTLGYLVPALLILMKNPEAKFVIATNSHALMHKIFRSDRPLLEQIAEQCGIKVTFSRLMGKANYVSLEKVRGLLLMDEFTDLDTVKVLEKLANWSKPLVEFEEEYGELPAQITPEMVTYSIWDDIQDIDDIRLNALSANFIVTTHAMVMVDCMCNHRILGDKENMYLIIDEADIFVDMLEVWKQRRFNLRELTSAFNEHIPRNGVHVIDQLMNDVTSIAGDLHFCSTPAAVALFDNSFNALSKVGREIKNEAARKAFFDCIYSWEMLGLSGGQKGVGVSNKRREPALIAVNPFIGMNVGRYCTQWRSALLTSATLSITSTPETGMEWLCKALGLTSDTISIRKIFSPDVYGSMKLTIAGADFPKVFNDPKEQIFSGQWLKAVVEQLSCIQGPALVLTASHYETRMIANQLGEVSQPVYIQKAGQALSEIIKQYQEKPGILISAGASVGVSPRGENGEQIFQDLIITRIPFLPPDRMKAESLYGYLKERGYSRTFEAVNRNMYLDNLRKVIRKAKQSIGRGIRSENDTVRIIILDPRFPEPTDLSSKHRSLEHIIPVRFRREYRSCEILSPAYCEEDIQC